RKEFGSNCTFIGVDKHVPSRVFTSVAGPVYLRPKYSIFRHAMQYTGAFNWVSNEWADFSFFPIPDGVLNGDSSLIFEWVDFEENDYRFSAYSQTRESMVGMPSYTLRNRILDQVGSYCPNGSANKEFIRTLRGNYIIWNNAENTIQGSKPNTRGYEGKSPIITHPTQLGEPVDNGKTWAVNSWFNFDRTNMLSTLLRYPTFRNLLMQAGLYDSASNGFPFLEGGRYYTILIPSDQALTDYQVDTLSKTDLADFLLYHFIQDNLIFTDNKSYAGDYYTLRTDETSFPTDYSTLNIRPGPDIIEILDTLGNPYVSIPEAVDITNIMVSTYSQTTAVIHEINEVLIKQ
ncbi:MAG: fasciclin domain-containing protein, partial [Bacteroidales bacterium]|nr:fasciclin domain-containing protein [Bacteroidales bacterium]